MYVVARHVKQDPEKRWGLPDRVFFACGACHILAYAFIERYGESGFRPIWIKPMKGYTGNHIVAVRDDLVFDFHGYSRWRAMRDHIGAKSNRWWPGWTAELVPLPLDVLVSERRSREFEGLWLREPKQFLFDALPRARRFLDRFPPPDRVDHPTGDDARGRAKTG